MRGTAAVSVAILVLLLASLPQAQGTPPPTPLTFVTREVRRPVATTVLGGQELIALDDLAALFQVSVREDTLAGGLTVTYKGRTIIASADQPMASVSGRVVSLPSPAVRVGRRWFVPVEFVSRALAPIYDQRIDLRRDSRLLILGDLRVPRVTARIDSPGPPTRASLEVSPPAPIATTIEAGRVVARIDADALDLRAPPGSAGLIDQIRGGDQPTTVVVTLSSRAATARVLPSQSAGASRIDIEVQATDGPAAAVSPLPAPDTPATALVAPRPVLQTLVIDPGHGGDDVGVHGAGGAEEKQLTLEVARRLRVLIETRMGIRVILTRDEDRQVTLDERAAVANNSKADLFLSLHFNAALSPSVTGAEVFHLRLDQEGEDVRRSAETEAVSLPVVGGANRTIDVLRWDLAQARHVDTSGTFAVFLEEDLRGHVPMGPRPLQAASLRVLTGANMPAALVEMAYLTNPADESRARSEAYQTAVSQALYNAVLRFRGHLDESRQP